jgi:hypothetical protein
MFSFPFLCLSVVSVFPSYSAANTNNVKVKPRSGAQILSLVLSFLDTQTKQT